MSASIQTPTSYTSDDHFVSILLLDDQGKPLPIDYYSKTSLQTGPNNQITGVTLEVDQPLPPTVEATVMTDAFPPHARRSRPGHDVRPRPGLPSSPVRDAINPFLGDYCWPWRWRLSSGRAIACRVGYVGLTDTGFLRLGPPGWRVSACSGPGGGGRLGCCRNRLDHVRLRGPAAGDRIRGAVRGMARAAQQGVDGAPAALRAAAGGCAAGRGKHHSGDWKATRREASPPRRTDLAVGRRTLGTVTGAAILVAAVWLINTVGLRWWRSGRGVALSLPVGLGLLLTAAVVAGSST